MNENQLSAICDPTRLRIIGLLAEEPQSNTEIFYKLKSDVKYRESIFKALEKLKAANLIVRTYVEKKGYTYSLNFTELKISDKLVIKKKN